MVYRHEIQSEMLRMRDISFIPNLQTSMWVLRGAFASIISQWSFSRTLLNLLSHGCRQKLVTLSWVSGKDISPPESTSTPLLHLCALISWQFLNFPPTMEILLAIIAHPIYPLPQTFSNFSRERKITPGLQLFFVFDIIYSDLIETHFSPVVSSGPHWPVSFHGTLLSSCCTINSISVPRWTHSWKKLIQLSPILWLLPQSYIFEESNSWTRWSI